MKLDKKGFTVIELILSFILVMFLAISLFALVNNYKNRQQIESIKRGMVKLQNDLTEDIYLDTIQKKVKNINYCLDYSVNPNGEIIKQCVDINFLDGSKKQLKIEQIEEQVEEDGTTFEFETVNFLYGGRKYKNPDPKFVKVVSDYMLTSTTEEDSLEYGKIYHIKIRIAHQDLEKEYVIDIVTTGIN